MNFLSKLTENLPFETKSFILFYLLSKYRFKYFDNDAIKNYQNLKMKQLVNFAIKRSSFYKNLYSGADLNNLWELPTINKKIIMDNLTEANTVGFSKKEVMDFCLGVEKTRNFSKRLKGFNVGMSSGTSGNKGVEIVSQEEENYMKAALFARFTFPPKEKINLAFILRVSAPAFNIDRFGHKLTYISQLDTIENITKKLEALNPNIISAPPSMLKLLAEEIEKGRLSISPKIVVSYAEVLYPDVKTYLAKVFNSPIHQIYKSTEGPIGITCKLGNLHINEDLVALQLYNSDGTATPPGVPCRKLIITDLHKKSLPIIRYELNDIITISKNKCGCGSYFRVIDSIQGRADDMFWGQRLDTGKKHFIYQDYISRIIISASDNIDDFQVVQKDYQKVLCRIKLKENSPGKVISEKVKKGIKELFLQYECIEPEVNVEFTEPVKNPNSNKLTRIICEIKK